MEENATKDKMTEKETDLLTDFKMAQDDVTLYHRLWQDADKKVVELQAIIKYLETKIFK